MATRRSLLIACLSRADLGFKALLATMREHELD
jgi:hypothetical protein